MWLFGFCLWRGWFMCLLVGWLGIYWLCDRMVEGMLCLVTLFGVQFVVFYTFCCWWLSMGWCIWWWIKVVLFVVWMFGWDGKSGRNGWVGTIGYFLFVLLGNSILLISGVRSMCSWCLRICFCFLFGTNWMLVSLFFWWLLGMSWSCAVRCIFIVWWMVMYVWWNKLCRMFICLLVEWVSWENWLCWENLLWIVFVDCFVWVCVWNNLLLLENLWKKKFVVCISWWPKWKLVNDMVYGLGIVVCSNYVLRIDF